MATTSSCSCGKTPGKETGDIVPYFKIVEKSKKKILIGCLAGGCLAFAVIILLLIGYIGFCVYRAQSLYENALKDPQVRRQIEEHEAYVKQSEEICSPEDLLTSPDSRRIWEKSEFNYFGSSLDVVTLPGFAHMGEKLPEMTEEKPATGRFLVEYIGALKAGDDRLQRDALQQLLEDEKALLEMTREAIFKDYRLMLTSMKDGGKSAIRLLLLLGGKWMSKQDFKEMFPEIEDPDELDPYILLDKIFVYRPNQEGKVCVGIVFSCSWTVDSIGVCIYDGTVVDCGIDAAYNCPDADLGPAEVEAST